jgi:hypothetical protein
MESEPQVVSHQVLVLCVDAERRPDEGEVRALDRRTTEPSGDRGGRSRDGRRPSDPACVRGRAGPRCPNRSPKRAASLWACPRGGRPRYPTASNSISSWAASRGDGPSPSITGRSGRQPRARPRLRLRVQRAPRSSAGGREDSGPRGSEWSSTEQATAYCEQDRGSSSRTTGGRMSIERIFYCDGPQCEHHARTASPRPTGFLTVTEFGTGRSMHFCSWDCILRHAAEKPPTEVVSAG